MARTPILNETVEERVMRISEELAVDPPFVSRVARASVHGDYLEAAHESMLRTLAVVHMRLSRGEVESATDLVAKLRQHLDRLWDQRREAAQLVVNP